MLEITITFLFVPIMHTVVGSIYVVLKVLEKKENIFYRFIEKTYKEMTFNVYVRYMYEIYLFLLLASISEVYYFRRDNQTERTS